MRDLKEGKNMVSILAAAILLGIISSSASGADLNPPVNLRVPVLAYDEKSIVLVWEKPENYSAVEDYHIYMNGQKIGSARKNFKENSAYTAAYMNAFYEGDKNKFHHKIDIHAFKAVDLEPSKEYKFTVRSVSEGKESLDSDIVIQKTTAKPDTFNILDYGAKDYGAVTDYTPEGMNEKIIKNTKAIQAAIDACTTGGKVIIPAGTYVSGAIWLKGDMTLELQEGAVLLGSPNADHYPRNYILYDYSTDTRAWALVNAYSYDHGQLKNIRIVGKGSIDGNGWKYVNPDKSLSDTLAFQTRDILDPKGKEYKLPNYLAGNNKKVTDGDEHSKFQAYGILAADASRKAQKEGFSVGGAYATRPNLVVLRGVDGIYLEGFTALNPAFHGIACLDSDNIISNSVVYKTYDTNNGDGIELGNSKNALIFGNFFDTGDDSVNFATGMGQAVKDSKQRSSSDVWIFNNFFREGHGGAIAAGSHTGAWIENLLAEDNVFNLTDMPFRFKSNILNGGGVRNVHIRDSAVAAPSKQVFTFSTDYSDNNQVIQLEPSKEMPVFKNIKAENITVSATGKAIPIEVKASLDKKWHVHNNLHFENIKFKDVQKGNYIRGLEDGTFKNIVMEGNLSSKEFWEIKDSKNLQFLGDTTAAPRAEDFKNTVIAKSSPEKTGEIEAPEKGLEVIAAKGGTGYTWAAIRWNGSKNASKYIVTVNGKEQHEIVPNFEKWEEVTYTVPGLQAGKENLIQVKAVNDSEKELAYKSVKVTTWKSYDKDAPKWDKNDKLNVEKIDNNSVELSWPAAKDSNEILGYRIYINGKPLKMSPEDEFTPVNDKYTTKLTKHIVKGLDLTKQNYDFKVEAGDIWWRSKEGKAPHHWTLSGPSAQFKVKK